MEGLAEDKHSSILRKSVNYGRKKFYNIRPECHNLVLFSRHAERRYFKCRGALKAASNRNMNKMLNAEKTILFNLQNAQGMDIFWVSKYLLRIEKFFFQNTNKY